MWETTQPNSVLFFATVSNNLNCTILVGGLVLFSKTEKNRIGHARDRETGLSVKSWPCWFCSESIQETTQFVHMLQYFVPLWRKRRQTAASDPVYVSWVCGAPAQAGVPELGPVNEPLTFSIWMFICTLPLYFWKEQQLKMYNHPIALQHASPVGKNFVFAFIRFINETI